MNLSKQVKKEVEKINLLNKVVSTYKNQLFEQGNFNFQDKQIIQIFENKNINYLKKWLKINEKLNSLR